MSPAAIQVEGVSKRYRIGTYGGAYLTLREALTSRFRREPDEARETWALRDVSLEIAEGEAVGVIGANGAGKSTLLKILARITQPSAGVSRTRGRVGSLLEVGTGFHPELTGKENVYLNAAILGMSRADVRRRFDEIVEFSGVERFLDTPLKRYSSGMYLRLAFAVAAHVEPEILVVDEVLAVGDARFRDKCLGKMTELGREGRTVLFVSHDLGAVTRLCPRAVWLDQGRVLVDGESTAVVDRYLSDAAPRAQENVFAIDPERDVQLLDVRLLDGEGHAVRTLRRGHPLTLAVRFVVRASSAPVSLAFIVHSDAGAIVLDEDWGADTGGQIVPVHLPQEYEARLRIPPVLPVGGYRLEVWLGTAFETLLRQEALRFDVAPEPGDPDESIRRRRIVQAPVEWSVAEAARDEDRPEVA